MLLTVLSFCCLPHHFLSSSQPQLLPSNSSSLQAPHTTFPQHTSSMRRIFGAPKKKEPPPTLEQAGANLDARGNRIDEQIKKLDQQLMQFREQIKKTRPGPAQEALKRRALTVRQGQEG